MCDLQLMYRECGALVLICETRAVRSANLTRGRVQ